MFARDSGEPPLTKVAVLGVMGYSWLDGCVSSGVWTFGSSV